MKKTISILMATAGALYAADSQNFTLVAGGATRANSSFNGLGSDQTLFFNVYAHAANHGMGTVFGAGRNNTNISNWSSYEGNNSVTATSVKIYGRTGVAGEYMAVGQQIDAATLDLARLATEGNSLTFTVALSRTDGNVSVNYTLGIAIVGVAGDGAKTLVASDTATAAASSMTTATPLTQSVTMDSYDADLTYYALTYIVGSAGSATNADTLNFDTYGVTMNIVPEDKPGTGSGAAPEPATATLSLLALAGLAARRRRK